MESKLNFKINTFDSKKNKGIQLWSLRVKQSKINVKLIQYRIHYCVINLQKPFIWKPIHYPQ